jgi:DegV family protein with EDD domain
VLSTTYQSAVIAAESVKEEYPEATIRVLDTKCASLGQGLLVYLCAQQQKAGKSLEEVYQYAVEMAPKMAHWVTVDDLNHLKRGGRISATTAFFGTMLTIKPLIHVDDEGRLINVGKARGRKVALTTLADEFEKRVLDPSIPVFISHGDCEEDAKFVAEELHKRTGAEVNLINYVGPVIGSHTGAGVIALCFLAKER